MSLNLFPARVPIGTMKDAAGVEQEVLMTVEFSRALTALFERVGGANGLSNEDLAVLSLQTPTADAVAQQGVEELRLNQPLDLGAQVAVLAQKINDIEAVQAAGASAQTAALNRRIEDLEAMLDAFSGWPAHVAALDSRVEGVQAESAAAGSTAIDWERPGRIGFQVPNTGRFLELRATSGEFSLPVDVKGNFLVVGTDVPASGAGGNVRHRDDTGSLRWLSGLLGSAGAIDYAIYDVVAGAPRFTIDSPGGTVRAGVGFTTPGQAQADTFRSTVGTGAGAPMIVNSTDLVIGLHAEIAERLNGPSSYGPVATDLATAIARINLTVDNLVAKYI